MNEGMAVPQKAQGLVDAFSEARQQETELDQSRKEDDESYSSMRECWRSNRRIVRDRDFCRQNEQHVR
jgi:hypothetical protein